MFCIMCSNMRLFLLLYADCTNLVLTVIEMLKKIRHLRTSFMLFFVENEMGKSSCQHYSQ